MSDYEHELLEMDVDQFKPFNLDGEQIVAKVLRVHDGDTITIGWKQDPQWVRTNVRLTGIDTPELHSKNAKESKLCRLGREWLKMNYLNKLIIVKCNEMDKYGRLLGELIDYSDRSININNKLISLQFARIYGGDLHKNEWSDDELDRGIASAEELNLTDPLK